MTQMHLERAGYTVDLASDGEQGLAMIQTGNYQVALVDYQLPKLNGLELIRTLAEESCLPPTIMLSGMSELAVAVEAMKLGAADYIIKEPGSGYLEHLSAIIERLLEREELLNNIRQADEQLRLAAAVFETTAEGIIITDRDNRIKAVNRAFYNITGYTEDEVIGKNPSLQRSGRHDLAYYQHMWRCLERDGKWEGEIWERRKNGEIYPAWIIINAVCNDQGETTGYVALFSDITERKRQEDKIWRQANFDALTGLPNRTLFMDRLSQAIHSAHREDWSVALMFIDLDHFKWINDSLGHEAGDQLLQEVAQRLRACARESDTVARLGGDEFTIILPDIDGLSGGEQVAKKVLESLAQPLTLAGREESLTSGSIGIAFYPDDTSNADTLLKYADMAMYQAKENGRNAFAFFTKEMNREANQRRNLELELQHALEGGELLLHYQPIISLESGQLASAEALLRWASPEHGMLLPGEFIPLAEETGLILPLGEWVLHAAVEQASTWHQRGLVVPGISVNLSFKQCRDPNFERKLRQVLVEAGLPTSVLRLGLEITEELLQEEGSKHGKMFQRINEMDVYLSIDHFGTGSSSLIQLKQFPVETIKIDRALVQDVINESKVTDLVQSIIALAHTLGMKVVAEGIETAEQSKFLTQAGCDFGQGYFFSKPISAQAFEMYLQSRS